MNISPQESAQLAKSWEGNPSRIIEGKNHTYKIDYEKFLGRGGFGIVFGGICRISQKGNHGIIVYKYREVAIKQFKKSQKWRRPQDQDKQVLLLNKYGKLLNSQYILEVIDIFEQKETHRYFMVTPLARGGTLNEKMGSFKDQDQIYRFSLRIASILKYFHYDALSNYRSKAKQKGEEEKQKIAIIHRDVKPQNIVFLQNEKIQSIYLLDFGIAKIAYSDIQKGYNNCGTSYYKASQIGQGRIYNAKVDVFSFACTLYEILNEGERMLTNYGLGTKYGDRQRFIKNRLIDLQLKLMKGKKIKHPYYWTQLLHNCLAYDIKKRYSSQELLHYLSANPAQNIIEEGKLFYGQIPQKQQMYKNKREIFDVNFELFRLNIIQNAIFTIFQFIYFEQPRINKFMLYTLIKFMTMTFADRYLKAKEKSRPFDRKYNQLKGSIQEKRINELCEKAHQKIKKEIEKQENNNRIQNKKKGSGPINDMISKYPEILHKKVVDPKRILSEFCYQKRNEMLQNQKFTRLILTIMCYLQELDYYDELKLQNAELDNSQIELLTIKKLNYFSKFIEDKLSRQFLKTKLQNCRVEVTLRSNINKQQNKTDLQIESVD